VKEKSNLEKAKERMKGEMNHLQEAKDKLELGTSGTMLSQADIPLFASIAHALIAIAEREEARLLLEASKVAELDKIAEQLEKWNYINSRIMDEIKKDTYPKED